VSHSCAELDLWKTRDKGSRFYLNRRLNTVSLAAEQTMKRTEPLKAGQTQVVQMQLLTVHPSSSSPSTKAPNHDNMVLRLLLLIPFDPFRGLQENLQPIFVRVRGAHRISVGRNSKQLT
jgi:hypothetical protein